MTQKQSKPCKKLQVTQNIQFKRYDYCDMEEITMEPQGCNKPYYCTREISFSLWHVGTTGLCVKQLLAVLYTCPNTQIEHFSVICSNEKTITRIILSNLSSKCLTMLIQYLLLKSAFPIPEKTATWIFRLNIVFPIWLKMKTQNRRLRYSKITTTNRS